MWIWIWKKLKVLPKCGTIVTHSQDKALLLKRKAIMGSITRPIVADQNRQPGQQSIHRDQNPAWWSSSYNDSNLRLYYLRKYQDIRKSNNLPIYLTKWTERGYISWIYIPYARHHKPLLITSRSWIQAIHKDRIYWKKPSYEQRNGLWKWGKKYTSRGL